MQRNEEGNKQVILDKLDFAPNSIYGFTGAEFGGCFFVSMILCVVPFAMLGKFVINSGISGAVAAVGAAFLITMTMAKRAEILKRNRPSYMLWIDLQRKIQFEGLFGIKFLRFNFGYISTHTWDNTKPENTERAK